MGTPATTKPLFDFNNDQIFSIARQLLTALSGLLVAVLPPDYMNLIISIAPVLVSVIWSLWRNADNRWDMVASATRQIVLFVGAFAVGKGWLSDTMVQYLAGAVFAIISSTMSLSFYGAAPGPKLPGTTIEEPKA